ncbi:MAG TPA: pilus assembly protein PilM, partial [Tepidisphaeraceae bacterium]
MLGFVQNWFAPRANPIGVDFGSDCLRLAQVQFVGDEYRLVAAASADVPSHLKQDPNARLEFFVETTRDLLAQANFKSRQAVLGLPASIMHIQHLRMAKMDEAETRKALPWEARGKLPIDPSAALLRHLHAGEVYEDQEAKNEVIVIAAAREFVNNLLASAAKAKLDVVGMNVEPKAIVDCFGHVYRRKGDSESTSLFLDIGLCGSRAVIARGGQIFFARTIPIGGDHFCKAVAHALRISADEAKLLRLQLCHSAPAAGSIDDRREKVAVSATKPAAVKPEVEEDAEAAQVPESSSSETVENSFALLGAGLQAASRQQQQQAHAAAQPGSAAAATAAASAHSSVEDELSQQARAVEQACRDPLNRLIEELDLCRRYYEATFPNRPVDRLVFVGGEARQRTLCQHIARELGVTAQVGDP